MINERTYYDILDLPKYGINDNGEKITYTNIERAYNRLRYGISNGEGRAQVWEMPLINEAFRVLSRPESRNKYDEYLRNLESSYENEVVVEPAEEEAKEEIKEEEAKEEETKEEEAKEEIKEEEIKEEEAKEEEAKEEIKEEEIKEEEAKEEEAKEEEAKEDTELNEKDENYKIRKANTKKILKNAGIIALSSVFGIVGIVASSIILAKKGKFKLDKISKTRYIKEIKTAETSIIDNAASKLEGEIDTLLEKTSLNEHDNYKLELAKLKYKNQIDLLNQRIEFKENEIEKLETKVASRLKLLALKMRVNASKKWLQLREITTQKKLDILDNRNSKSNDGLSKLNKEIAEIKTEIKSGNLTTHQQTRKKVKLKKLNQKRIDKIENFKTQKGFISRNQVLYGVFDSIKNVFIKDEEEKSKTK